MTTRRRNEQTAPIVNEQPAQPDLEGFKTRLNAFHHDIAQAFRSAYTIARNAGEQLHHLKGLLFGQWEEWVSANLIFSLRTAQIYIRFYEHWALLEPALADKEPFGIADADRLLSLLLNGVDPVEAKKAIVEKREATRKKNQDAKRKEQPTIEQRQPEQQPIRQPLTWLEGKALLCHQQTVETLLLVNVSDLNDAQNMLAFLNQLCALVERKLSSQEAHAA